MVFPLVGELCRNRLNFHDGKKKAAEAALPCMGHKTNRYMKGYLSAWNVFRGTRLLMLLAWK